MSKEVYLEAMKKYFDTDERRIRHAGKVLDFASRIATGEGVDAETEKTVWVAAILRFRLFIRRDTFVMGTNLPAKITSVYAAAPFRIFRANFPAFFLLDRDSVQGAGRAGCQARPAVRRTGFIDGNWIGFQSGIQKNAAQPDHIAELVVD